jgi:peptide/nickel transport system ATP-binding protein
VSAVPISAVPASPNPAGEPLVQVRDLTVRFTNSDATIHAVNGVSFDLHRGEVLGILGESGSGKSVTLKTLMRLLPERKTKLGGTMRVAGQDVIAMNASQLTAYRGKIVSMIFQEPMLAFDPVFTIGQQIGEAVIKHEGVSKAEARKRALQMLERVQIPSAVRRLDAYPHELSGGMRQRAMIALALACKPQLLLADEPTTALDATVQIQILLLLRELQKEFGMAVIFVTHDVGAAVEVSDRIAVMYAGRFIETGDIRALIRQPRHPYSQGLLAANVLPGSAREGRVEAIPGSPPNLAAVPPGCAFAPRCKYVEERCRGAYPVATTVAASHTVHCILSEAGAQSAV